MNQMNFKEIFNQVIEKTRFGQNNYVTDPLKLYACLRVLILIVYEKDQGN